MLVLAACALLVSLPTWPRSQAETPRIVRLEWSSADLDPEGRRPARRIEHAVEHAGRVHVWTRSRDEFDPFVRIERPDGALVIEDDSTGGGAEAYARVDVVAGDVLRVLVRGSAGDSAGSVEVHFVASVEDDASREAVIAARAAISEVTASMAARDRDGARRLVSEAVDALLASPACARADSITAMLRELAVLARKIGDVEAEGRAIDGTVRGIERVMPADHVERHRVRFELARSLSTRGADEEALEVGADALAGLERALPRDSVELQEARLGLSILKKVRGDLSGARELGERALTILEAQLAADDARLLTAQDNVAVTRAMQGDLAGAREVFARIVETLDAKGDRDSTSILNARMNLARAHVELGDYALAREQQEKVLEVRLGLLPPENPDVVKARQNLAITLRKQGDLVGAQMLLEATLDSQSGYPEGHPGLQGTLTQLSLVRRSLGDLSGAIELGERVLAGDLATLSPDDESLQRTRLNLAASYRQAGDPSRALPHAEAALESALRNPESSENAVSTARGTLGPILLDLGHFEEARDLQEAVLIAQERALAPDHVDLLRTRHNLSLTLQSLGDLASALEHSRIAAEGAARTLRLDESDRLLFEMGYAGLLLETGDVAAARALQERILEVRSTTLHEDHPEVESARQNLAAILEAAGDLDAGRALHERVLAGTERRLSESHPDVFAARLNVGTSRAAAGDFAGAREILERALAADTDLLSDDDPRRQSARIVLAGVLRRSGDHERARELETRVLDFRTQRLTPDHPEMLSALRQCAVGIALDERARRSGETGGGASAMEPQYRALARRHIEGLALAARQVLLATSGRAAAERGASLGREVVIAESLASGYGVFEPDPELRTASFLAAESLRAAAYSSARFARRADRDPRSQSARDSIRAASVDLADAAKSGAPAADVDAARARRDAAEAELFALARAADPAAIETVTSLDTVSNALSPDSALIVYRALAGCNDVDGVAVPERLVGYVVRRDAPLARFELGPLAPVERAIDAWRATVAAGAVPSRGLASAEARDPIDAESTVGSALRRLVLDPLLPACGTARALFVVADGALHLVPFDALPSDDVTKEEVVRRVGDRFAVRPLANIAECIATDRPTGSTGLLVAVGGVDYERVAAVDVDAQSDRVSSRGSAPRAAGFALGSLSPLPQTAHELDGVTELFRARPASAGDSETLRGSDATVERFLELAPRAQWLHVATHGWFARDAVTDEIDTLPLDAQSGLGTRSRTSELVRRSSPMLLCGIALAGANLPADSRGRRRGLLTAEEMSTLDLTRCDLVVLSACETNVGESKAGQGLASLQQALRIAGARSVITASWAVPDEPTKELMLEFYRRAWVDGVSLSDALWDAKCALRDARDEQGSPRYSTRDWAAWMLTGESH